MGPYMVLSKEQVDNITNKIIIDYIMCKKIAKTGYEDIVKHIPDEYLENPMIKEILDADPYEENSLVDLVSVKACRQFIEDVERVEENHYINNDFIIDFRKRVEDCIKAEGIKIIDADAGDKMP